MPDYGWSRGCCWNWIPKYSRLLSKVKTKLWNDSHRGRTLLVEKSMECVERVMPMNKVEWMNRAEHPDIYFTQAEVLGDIRIAITLNPLCWIESEAETWSVPYPSICRGSSVGLYLSMADGHQGHYDCPPCTSRWPRDFPRRYCLKEIS